MPTCVFALWRAGHHNLPVVIRHNLLNMGQEENSVLTSFTIPTPYRVSKTHTSACLHVNTTHRWVEQSQKWQAWSLLPGAWRPSGKAAQWCLETETDICNRYRGNNHASADGSSGLCHIFISVCWRLSHPEKSSLQSLRAARTPAGPGQRSARRGWAGWGHNITSGGAWWLWRSHRDTAPYSSHSTARYAWPAPLKTHRIGRYRCAFSSHIQLSNMSNSPFISMSDQGKRLLPTRSHSPLGMYVDVSTSSIWRSSSQPLCVQEPNFKSHFCTSNGNQRTSM